MPQTADYWDAYRLRRDRDPYLAERERARARGSMAAYRERMAARGRTFTELLATSPEPGGPRSTRAGLRAILREEVAAGRVVYRASCKRYELVHSAFDPATLKALEHLGGLLERNGNGGSIDSRSSRRRVGGDSPD